MHKVLAPQLLGDSLGLLYVAQEGLSLLNGAAVCGKKGEFFLGGVRSSRNTEDSWIWLASNLAVFETTWPSNYVANPNL